MQLQGTSSAPNASPALAKREVGDHLSYRPSPTAQHFSPYPRLPPPPNLPSSSSPRMDHSYSPAYGSPLNPLAMVSQQATRERETEPESSDMKVLWDKFLRSNIGEQSIDWQLAKPTMAESLTLHLLEGESLLTCETSDS